MKKIKSQIEKHQTILKHAFSFLFLIVVFFSANYFNNILSAQAAKTLLDSQEGLSGRDSEISVIFEEGIEDRDIRVIVADTIRIFLGFLGIIFVVLLIIAGFKYMTAGGNEENVSESLKQIRHAIIGLVIILAAYAIATFVVAQVRKAVIDPSF